MCPPGKYRDEATGSCLSCGNPCKENVRRTPLHPQCVVKSCTKTTDKTTITTFAPGPKGGSGLPGNTRFGPPVSLTSILIVITCLLIVFVLCQTLYVYKKNKHYRKLLKSHMSDISKHNIGSQQPQQDEGVDKSLISVDHPCIQSQSCSASSLMSRPINSASQPIRSISSVNQPISPKESQRGKRI